MSAISTDLLFVKQGCPPGIYRSFWDLLCEQLFAQSTLGLYTEGVFPDVVIWNEGVELMDSTAPSFKITTSAERTPRVSDIIFFKRKFYIIGAVTAGESAGEYICTDCKTIDASILSVYVALLTLRQTLTSEEGERDIAEAARVLAEQERVATENRRAAAESSRVEAEILREVSESSRVEAENERESAEEEREITIAQVRSDMTALMGKFVLISDVEYAALVEAGTVDPTKLYFVYESEEENEL